MQVYSLNVETSVWFAWWDGIQASSWMSETDLNVYIVLLTV